jgi:hypothetical protein
VFGAELSLFLLKIAAASVDLLEERSGKVGVVGLESRIGGDHRLRIALRSGAVLSLGKNAVCCRSNELAAELVNLQQS